MRLSQNLSISLLAQEMKRYGYSVDFFDLQKTAYARFTAPNGNVWLTSCARVQYPFIGNSASSVSDYKDRAYALAKMFSINVPFTQVATANSAQELDMANLLSRAPLIVKPNDASLSRGLTMNVSDESALNRALTTALRYSASVLIQEQLTGEEVRFVVVNNKVTGAILRQTPRVTGDGNQTISQLISRENFERTKINLRNGVRYPLLDASMISLKGSRLSEVPALGETVELGKGTMIRNGASMYNVSSLVHPSYAQAVEALARSMGAGFVVIDMLLHDFASPLTPTNHALMEFNTSPALSICYSTRNYQNYDVLSDLVPTLDAAISAH